MWFRKRAGDFIRRGDAANRSRSWSVAELHYRKALELNPDLPQIWMQYGHALKEQGKLSEAEQAYWRSLALERTADSYLQIGHILKLQSRRDEAVLAYMAARNMDSGLQNVAEELTNLEAEISPSPRRVRMVRVPFDEEGYAHHAGTSPSDALTHYISGGFRRYRPLQGVANAPYTTLNTQLIDDHYREIYRDNFDPSFYWSRYPEISASGADPLEDFYETGWRKHRDPSADFSVDHYLSAYPDVREAEIDPFVHHLLFGRLLGRVTAKSAAPRPLFKTARGDNMRLDPVAQTVSDSALYRFCRAPVRLQPPSQTFVPDALDIHIVVPDFSSGSGGHMNVFRICNFLEATGHRITIWIRDRSFHKTTREAVETLNRDFQHLQATIKFVDDTITKATGDVVVATDWRSVPIVWSVAGFKRRFYLVQDFEPAFHPAGSLSLLAELTYRSGFDCICGGPWLENLMVTRYGLWARKFWQAADTTTYRDLQPPKSSQRETPHIAFYARMFTDRRAVEIGLLALELLHERGIKFHVDFFGQNEKPFDAAPYPATHHGILDANGLATIYNYASVGMALSATNYSIVPQEMMACGLAVVDLDVESTRAIYADVVRLAGPAPDAVADAVEALLTDAALRIAQVNRAKQWVSQFTWAKSAKLVESAFIDRLNELSFQPRKPAIGKDRSYFATVVIPTYNGGELLRKVVDVVLTQRVCGDVHLLCIDSSSDDGTNEYLVDHPNVDLITIAKEDFQHGATRNRGVEMAKAEFIAFLTQDALPGSPMWLHNLVSVLKIYPNAGGVFGRHMAHDSASIFIRREIDQHFAQFDGLPTCIDPSDGWVAERWSDQAFRQQFHFYSDNNSCLKKSVWQVVPIPPLDFGEDQVFAYNLLQSGYGKAYARNAMVFHSHDDPPEVTEQRSYDEATFFYQRFGYRFASSELDVARDLYRRNTADQEFAAANGIDRGILDSRLAQNRAKVTGATRAMRDAGVLDIAPQTRGGRVVGGQMSAAEEAEAAVAGGEAMTRSRAGRTIAD